MLSMAFAECVPPAGGAHGKFSSSALQADGEHYIKCPGGEAALSSTTNHVTTPSPGTGISLGFLLLAHQSILHRETEAQSGCCLPKARKSVSELLNPEFLPTHWITFAF